MSFSGQYPPPVPPRRPVPSPSPPSLPLSSKPTAAHTRNPITTGTPTPPIIIDSDVVSSCPENDGLYAAAYWYTLPNISSFKICSYCFATHIRSTQWSANFRRDFLQPDPSRKCQFSTPRMRELWSSLLRNENWASIRAYMAHRVSIKDCKRLTPVSAEEGMKWYSLVHDIIPNFGICAACYEDVALATPFGRNFHLNIRGQPAGEMWICDMTAYARRALEKFGKTNNWRDVIATITRAMQIPPCKGAVGVDAVDRGWYRPRAPIKGLMVCDACYWEYLAASFMDHEWEAVSVDFRNAESWVCDMSLLSMKAAYLHAMTTKDYGAFWNAARMIIASPPCPSGGQYAGVWHTLRRDRRVHVCAQCFAGMIYIYNFGSHFEPVQAQIGQHRICIFNISTPRRLSFVTKLDECVSLRDFSKFEDYAIRFAALPVCPTYNMVEKRRWYGSDDFLICESCWEEFAKETCLASTLPHQGLIIPQACCDLYSSRMRDLWTSACAKNNMAEFIAFAKHRNAVYEQTVPHMQRILAMSKMRLRQKQTLMMSSIILQGSDNLVSLTQDPSQNHTLYGNSDVGYSYATDAGVLGAQQFKQALGIPVVQRNEMAQLAQLEAIWKQVE